MQGGKHPLVVWTTWLIVFVYVQRGGVSELYALLCGLPALQLDDVFGGDLFQTNF